MRPAEFAGKYFFQTLSQSIGTCDFKTGNQHSHWAVIGYDLIPEYCGQGFMHEVLANVIQMAYQ